MTEGGREGMTKEWVVGATTTSRRMVSTRPHAAAAGLGDLVVHLTVMTLMVLRRRRRRRRASQSPSSCVEIARCGAAPCVRV
jgi:hypothetical protein